MIYKLEDLKIEDIKIKIDNRERIFISEQEYINGYQQLINKFKIRVYFQGFEEWRDFSEKKKLSDIYGINEYAIWNKIFYGLGINLDFEKKLSTRIKIEIDKILDDIQEKYKIEI